ncbi:MAG TPA: phosphatidylglycerophosphatase A [Bryobacteraceae bacterium]|nr:phosphatidylglycerophosphatase A [Bryobacteraceae bacterium]
MKVKVAHLLSTWFGCGAAPLAPGTVGAAAAVAIAYLLNWSNLAMALAGIICGVIGIWAATVEAASCGRKDPGHIVIDEVAGQWITLAGATVFSWKSWILGFVLFRLFDIWKPAPVRQLEKLPGGTGIMADDLMAGVYAAVVLYLAGYFHLY